jgi:hypothetical protein
MVYFDKEVLEGLEEIPTPNSPGSLIVTANAQSIYSGPNAGESIFAGHKYGRLAKKNAKISLKI